MQRLLFGDTEITTPTVFKIDKEKVMSDNAGLSSTCIFVGDVKGIVTTIHIEWAGLKPAEVKAINDFILNMDSLYFPVTYLNEEFEEITVQMRAEGPAYEQWGWDPHRRLCKVLSVDLYSYSGAGGG